MMLWAEGFDAYGDDEAKMLDGPWAEISSVTLSNVQVRTGTRSLLVDSVGSKARRVLGGNKPIVGVAQAIYIIAHPSVPNTTNLIAFKDSNNFPQLLINLDTTGAVSAWCGDDNVVYGELQGVSTDLIVTNAWNHLEVRVDFGAGNVEVRLNGVTILNLAAVHVVNLDPLPGRATGQASAAQIAWGSYAGAGHADIYVDDVVVWDGTGAQNNTFVGDRKVYTDFPTGDTAEQDWDRSAGASSFALLDENPDDGDGTYVTTETTGDRFGVTFPALPAQVTSVAAVIFQHKSKKTDAGDCNIQLHCASGASEADGLDRPMTTAYTAWQDVFEVDPDTSAPFTKAAAEAASLVTERTL